MAQHRRVPTDPSGSALRPCRSWPHRSRPVRFAALSCSLPRSSAPIARTIRSAPSGASASCRSAAVIASGDRDAFGHRHVAGVEACVHLHHHHAALGVTGHDGAVDRRGPAPARQQRAVQVEAASGGASRSFAAGSCHRRRPRRHRRCAANSSSASGVFSVDGVDTAMPSRRASCSTGVGCSFMPRPAGFAARV